VEATYTSNQVLEMTGITARQLQWWDERGIVVPARSGHRRLYSAEDLAEIAVICELRRRGFSLQRVRKVMRFLQKEMGRRLVETTAANSEIHLLTDGKHIFLEDSERGVIDVLKNSRQPLLAVCLSDAVQRVQGGGVRKRQQPKKRVVRASAKRASHAGVDLRSALRNRKVSRLRSADSSKESGAGEGRPCNSEAL